MYENYYNCHHRKTTRTFKYTKRGGNCQTLLYAKSTTLVKKLDNFGYVFEYKKPYTWRYWIFMKFLKISFEYKKHDTLHYVTFIYKKLDTSQKAK